MAQCKDGFPNTLALSSLLIMGSSLWCANLQYCSTNNWPGLLLILSNDGLHLWFIQPSPRGHEKCWIYILEVKSLLHSRNWYCYISRKKSKLWRCLARDSRDLKIESKKIRWMVVVAWLEVIARLSLSLDWMSARTASFASSFCFSRLHICWLQTFCFCISYICRLHKISLSS